MLKPSNFLFWEIKLLSLEPIFNFQRIPCTGLRGVSFGDGLHLATGVGMVRPFAPLGELARKSTLEHSKCSGWWSGHVIIRFQCFRTYSMCLSGLWLAISMKFILAASPHNSLEMMMIPFLPILGDVDLFSELWLRII